MRCSIACDWQIRHELFSWKRERSITTLYTTSNSSTSTVLASLRTYRACLQDAPAGSRLAVLAFLDRLFSRSAHPLLLHQPVLLLLDAVIRTVAADAAGLAGPEVEAFTAILAEVCSRVRDNGRRSRVVIE